MIDKKTMKIVRQFYMTMKRREIPREELIQALDQIEMESENEDSAVIDEEGF